MSRRMIILARHAESNHNNNHRIQGHSDSQLTARGVRQAKSMGRFLKSYKVKRIYCSDLGRARQTTKLLNQSLKCKVITDPIFREIYLGSWEGLTPAEVNERFDNGFIKWRKSPTRMKIPKSESVPHFRGRIRNALKALLKADSANPILIVTHGGVVASIIADWLGASFDRVIMDLRLDNSGLTFAEETQKGYIIHAINDVTHLGQNKNNEIIFNQHR